MKLVVIFYGNIAKYHIILRQICKFCTCPSDSHKKIIEISNFICEKTAKI